jgi:hypothetical protein
MNHRNQALHLKKRTKRIRNTSCLHIHDVVHHGMLFLGWVVFELKLSESPDVVAALLCVRDRISSIASHQVVHMQVIFIADPLFLKYKQSFGFESILSQAAWVWLCMACAPARPTYDDGSDLIGARRPPHALMYYGQIPAPELKQMSQAGPLHLCRCEEQSWMRG